MAGQRHRIELGPNASIRPWPVVVEIARVVPPDEWALVGGLMVRLHEYRAGLAPTRATRDVDVVVDITISSLAKVGGALATIGFSPVVPEPLDKPVYRFERAGDQVDVLLPDHLPAGRRASQAVASGDATAWRSTREARR